MDRIGVFDDSNLKLSCTPALEVEMPHYRLTQDNNYGDGLGNEQRVELVDEKEDLKEAYDMLSTLEWSCFHRDLIMFSISNGRIFAFNVKFDPSFCDG